MKKQMQVGIFLAVLVGSACSPNTGSRGTEQQVATSPTYTMEQEANGKWVIMDDSKKTLYDVFIYDNGPDYPEDGLIWVVKNGKIGYADAETYAIVIAPQFDCAFPFQEGKARVSNQCQTVQDGEHSVWESDAWQEIDKKGQILTK